MAHRIFLATHRLARPLSSSAPLSRRVEVFGGWLAAAPFSDASQQALRRSRRYSHYAPERVTAHSGYPKPLLVALRTVLGGHARPIFAALLPQHREALRAYVSWLLAVTASDVRAFATPQSGWLVNTLGRRLHAGPAQLAREVAVAAGACGVVGEGALVPDMPYLDPPAEVSPLMPVPSRTAAVPRVRSWFVVLASANNWEGGDISTDVPSVAVLRRASAGHAAFRRACKTLRIAVDEETRRVEAGVAAGVLRPTGGCGVLLRLYQLPRAAYRRGPDGSYPAEDLEAVARIIEDASYSVEYGDGESFSGAESDAGSWAEDVCLEDYLPAPEEMPGHETLS